MTESALVRAERAIELAAREQSDTLDLHGLGLKTLPPLTAVLRHLRRFDLSGNRLKSLPADLWQLVGLEDLNLSGNRLAVLDAEIGHLQALRVLDLSENRLTELPSELAACARLERLDLFGNLLKTLPEAILSLSALQGLDLASNRLATLPDLRSLANLQVLDLASNALSEAPAGVADLHHLRTLDISSNRLTSVSALVLPGSIEELFLDDNQLTEVPVRLMAIKRLSARRNPITLPESELDPASMPSRVGSLRDLVTGGSQPGKMYFEAPNYELSFSVELPTQPAVASSLDLYFKSFAGAPVSMQLDDGSRVDLALIGRHDAREIVASADRVLLEFPPTPHDATVAALCEFAERTLERADDAMLIESTGSASKSAKPELPQVDPDADASLPTAIPAGSRSFPSAPSAPAAEPVDAAVFCPAQVARSSEFLVQVFLYSPPAAAEADALAKQADEEAERLGTFSLPLDVPLGTQINLHLEFPDLTVREPDAVLLWRGRTTAAQFEVAVPAHLADPKAIGRVRIAVAGIPAGTLRFQVMLTAAGDPPSPVDARQLKARRYHRAFVSYSSQDRAEVLRRVQAFQIAGLSVFQDINLGPGERWNQALYREIDHCDVFLLFWSHAAAESKWVGKEIAYALARKQGNEDNPPDIQPVPIEGPPIVRPPTNLEGLHFNDALLAQILVADMTKPSRNDGDHADPHPGGKETRPTQG
jgi:hypothetical protein